MTITHPIARLNRRALLLGAAGTTLTALLAACGGETPATATVPAPATAAGATPTVGAAAVATTPATAAATVAATVAAATQAPAATGTIAPATTAATAAMSMTTGTVSGGTAMPMMPVATLREVTAAGTPVSVRANTEYRGKLSLRTVNIAFIPSNDSDAIFDRYKDFLAYFKESFGVEVKGNVGSSYSAVIEAMRAKKVDIAYYGPFSYILAHQETNAQPLVLPATKDGKLATYTSSIIAPPDSPINTLADLRGKRVSYVDAASTSGYLIPSYTLLTKVGLRERADYTFNYAGSHPASYQAVVNRKVDAGAVSTTTLTGGLATGAVKMGEYKVIDVSIDIPSSPIAHRGDLLKSDSDILKQFYLSLNDLPRDSNIGKAVFTGTTASFLPGDDNVYNELRKIPPALGIDLKMLD